MTVGEPTTLRYGTSCRPRYENMVVLLGKAPLFPLHAELPRTRARAVRHPIPPTHFTSAGYEDRFYAKLNTRLGTYNYTLIV
ncbi:hypothetical protein MAMT_00761 [Methylacidimicrobium tartarophylax]|uniref:Uncharacterized protein n=1 Tax=Methylacidimicrobium tartarophylax TaxID=1041768 RepID=A0A5E6M8M3_9BACT|nr:hypothetical protein MAMT_00761 [Methylacidimicrobium tartarophylax]